jgi:hypothetical protein
VSRPPVFLTAIVQDPDGTNAEQFAAYKQPKRNACTIDSITTKLGTGFESSTINLYRDPRKTYGSPRILQELKIVGAGMSAWEGRIDNVPPTRGASVQSSGWYSALRDNNAVAEVYKDQDVSQWQGMSYNRQAQYYAANSVPTDPTSADASVKLVLAPVPWTNPGYPGVEAWYTAPPGVNLSSFTGTATALNDPGATKNVNFMTVDSITGTYDSSAYVAGVVSATAGGTGRRFIALQFSYAGTNPATDSAERSMTFTGMTVTGDHGLTNIYASEVIKHVIGKYCPLLVATSSTISPTTYSIGQLVFDGATAEDVVLNSNAFHLWEFAVWEGRECFYASPRDLTDYDYELSIFRGDNLVPAGPSVDDSEPCNGYWVNYTNVATGRAERVGPLGSSSPYDTAGDAALLDTDPENPCNREGALRFPRLDIGSPCTRADAIVFGSLKLAEAQTSKNLGTGTAIGYVRNRAGAQVPAWMIRSGDRVRYSHETDVIRRVYGTSYSASTVTNSLTFESPASTLDGIFERIGMRLTTAGIA